MLFFIESEKLDALKKIIRHYALEVDGDEKGAAENRCDFKQIDPNKGSATGYILKYIAKNILGNYKFWLISFSPYEYEFIYWRN